MLSVQDNRPRFRDAKAGHVESWFFRANDPHVPRAIWLKATVLKLTAGPVVAEAWCCTFDSDGAWGARATVPIDEARADGAPLELDFAGCRFVLGPDGGSARGALSNEAGSCRWDLSWNCLGGPIARSLTPYPSRRLLEIGFPKFKLTTPQPAIRVDGRYESDGEVIPVRGWSGTQGHNWGTEYSAGYAWGTCWFPGEGGAPATLAEGFTGHVRVAGPIKTPWWSALIVRRGGAEYRFDRFYASWNQDAEVGDLAWRLRIRGSAGEAELSMDADPHQIACLGYRNPDGRLAYCLNSKIGRARLAVRPANGPPFEVESAHGAALEILRWTPDPRFGRPI